MAEETGIEWADSTHNEWMGCQKVSPACDNCYAEAQMDTRMHVVQWGPGADRKRTSPSNRSKPKHWNRVPFFECGDCHWRGEGKQIVGHACPRCGSHTNNLLNVRRRVFSSSLSDWLDNAVPIAWLVELLETVRSTTNMDWLLLTKRIGNWRPRLEEVRRYIDAHPHIDYRMVDDWIGAWLAGVAPGNVWLGISIPNQPEADREIPKILKVPALVRFLSMEPLLGYVDLRLSRPPACDNGSVPGPGGVGGVTCGKCLGEGCRTGIHWVIVGGESGRVGDIRPMHPAWAADLRDQCERAGVAYLFKQWGEWAPLTSGTTVLSYEARKHAEAAFVRVDGSRHGFDDHEPYNASDAEMYRVGKKVAGRRLDGRLHSGYPSPGM